MKPLLAVLARVTHGYATGTYSDSKWSCSTVTWPKNSVEAPRCRSMRW